MFSVFFLNISNKMKPLFLNLEQSFLCLDYGNGYFKWSVIYVLGYFASHGTTKSMYSPYVSLN